MRASRFPPFQQGSLWFDSLRTRRSPANMIRAQRDVFGAHGIERRDGRDAPHEPWFVTSA
ncbi:hypothetical protein [Salipiger mangrovisoli]|uniref:hypothetical protein n=1 Tax=Salipiger mangrovisoli TaxID=2865933 RepID=UPI0030B83F50